MSDCRGYEAVTELKPGIYISATLPDLLGMVRVRHFKGGHHRRPAAHSSEPAEEDPRPPHRPLLCLNECIVSRVNLQMVRARHDLERRRHRRDPDGGRRPRMSSSLAVQILVSRLQCSQTANSSSLGRR